MDLAIRALERPENELAAGGKPRLRASARFPLALPLHVVAETRQYNAVTDNISASGILFHLDELLPPGTEVEFLIEIPAGIIGAQQTAAVHCTGRIVRSYIESSKAFAAAVIDEYSFQ
jgi:PilZ domain